MVFFYTYKFKKAFKLMTFQLGIKLKILNKGIATAKKKQ